MSQSSFSSNQHDAKPIELPPNFATSFVMPDEFSKQLKLKSFVCWKMVHSIESQLNQTHDQAVYTATLQSSSHELQQLMTIGWETIHCGKWDEIDLIWRDLYAFACYGNAGILLLNHDVKQCIHTLDLGIMMGHRTYQTALQSFVEYAHTALVNTLLHSQHHPFHFPTLRFIQSNQTKEEEKDKPNAPNYLNCPVHIPVIDKANLIETRDVEDIDLIHFITNHFTTEKPVLIKRLVSHWPCIEKWKDLQYLMNSAGFRTVPVEIGKVYTDDDWTQKLMPLHQFMSQYLLATDVKERGYLAQHLLFEQIQCFDSDFGLPDFVHVGKEDFDSNGAVNCWFGPQGTITPIHHDPKHNILTQIVGYKYLRIYPPGESDNLYPRKGILNNTSQVSPEQEEERIEKQFPKFRNAKYVDVVLEPGDGLYMPPKYWHYVKSLSVSFSLSFWFE
eukprot:288911_1